jgi:hypothetical protein
MSHTVTNWLFRIAFGGFLLYESYQIVREDLLVHKKNINLAVGYYHDRFHFVSDFRERKPEVFNDLDSLIQSALSVFSLWAGVAMILGSNIMPAILTLIHGIGMLLFLSNTWTPKDDNEESITNMLIALAEICGAILIAFGRKPDVPKVTFKQD